MPLSLDLQLDERDADRVVVSVRVSPEAGGQRVDGVALQLTTRQGEGLGPRLLVPLCGCLAGPIVTRVELKSQGPIPPDAQVVAVAWWERDQVEVRCPTDFGTSLEHHLRGRRQVPLPSRLPVERLLPEERTALLRHMPWVADPIVPVEAREIEPLESEATAEEICEELGLEGEEAEWLKDLLDEDDAAL